ncbi:MAG: hypothetical protein M3082_14230 [Candidatus Dormibacteraeota bacterium]|nr:hypothetical protein [Candidatus Dormibacteraeota bacterium]
MLTGDVSKLDLTPIGPMTVEVIERELRAEGMPIDTFGELDPTEVQVATTANRSVLG